MPVPAIRYLEDRKGTNPNNFVANEHHTLSTRLVRALAPTYGPYFSESLVVYDNVTNRLLERGVDYQCVEMLQTATLKIGKEICELILIINQAVSSEVRINYYVLGGLYQNSSENIVSMYETAMSDNRSVDWSNIQNKPLGYPPALHNHLLSDVVGFEPVVAALERVRNAIVLSDVPAFEAIMNWVRARTLDTVTEDDIEQMLAVNKVVTFDKLLYALDKLNFNGITLSPDLQKVRNGSHRIFTIAATNLPDNVNLFWTIEHYGTVNEDFNLLSGFFNVVAGRGTFSISVANNMSLTDTRKFKVAIRRNGVTGPILTQTRLILISEAELFGFEEYLARTFMSDPIVDLTPESLFFTDFA